mmetsp:Transcript_39797/g.119671  ORF Transcript_39797/g.119671 Transcript_39797/m.119671 type:complete len:137 (-) Transcript_39797:803-1213(-)
MLTALGRQMERRREARRGEARGMDGGTSSLIYPVRACLRCPAPRRPARAEPEGRGGISARTGRDVYFWPVALRPGDFLGGGCSPRRGRRDDCTQTAARPRAGIPERKAAYWQAAISARGEGGRRGPQVGREDAKGK